MKRGWTSCFRNGVGKRSVAALLLLLWLNVLAVTALPQLHAAIHSDAHKAGHECVVTAVAQGNFHFSGPATVSVAPVQAVQIGSANFVSFILSAIPHRLAPGRAPPATFSNLV